MKAPFQGISAVAEQAKDDRNFSTQQMRHAIGQAPVDYHTTTRAAVIYSSESRAYCMDECGWLPSSLLLTPRIGGGPHRR
jgi:hypothetical protein